MVKIRDFKELLEEKISRWEEINKSQPDLKKAQKSSANIYKKIHSENKKFCDSMCVSLLRISKKDVKKFPNFNEEIKYRMKQVILDLKIAFLEVNEKKNYKKAVRKLKLAMGHLGRYEKLIKLLEEKSEIR